MPPYISQKKLRIPSEEITENAFILTTISVNRIGLEETNLKIVQH